MERLVRNFKSGQYINQGTHKEIIRQNPDPRWLHQNEMWEYIEQPEYESKN